MTYNVWWDVKPYSINQANSADSKYKTPVLTIDVCQSLSKVTCYILGVRWGLGWVMYPLPSVGFRRGSASRKILKFNVKNCAFRGHFGSLKTILSVPQYVRLTDCY